MAVLPNPGSLAGHRRFKKLSSPRSRNVRQRDTNSVSTVTWTAALPIEPHGWNTTAANNNHVSRSVPNPPGATRSDRCQFACGTSGNQASSFSSDVIQTLTNLCNLNTSQRACRLVFMGIAPLLITENGHVIPSNINHTGGSVFHQNALPSLQALPGIVFPLTLADSCPDDALRLFVRASLTASMVHRRQQKDPSATHPELRPKTLLGGQVRAPAFCRASRCRTADRTPACQTRRSSCCTWCTGKTPGPAMSPGTNISTTETNKNINPPEPSCAASPTSAQRPSVCEIPLLIRTQSLHARAGHVAPVYD